MIFGADVMLYSTDAAADRAFLAEGLGFPAVVADPDGCLLRFFSDLGVRPI
jgi:hypothetical protein